MRKTTRRAKCWCLSLRQIVLEQTRNGAGRRGRAGIPARLLPNLLAREQPGRLFPSTSRRNVFRRRPHTGALRSIVMCGDKHKRLTLRLAQYCANGPRAGLYPHNSDRWSGLYRGAGRNPRPAVPEASRLYRTYSDKADALLVRVAAHRGADSRRALGSSASGSSASSATAARRGTVSVEDCRRRDAPCSGNLHEAVPGEFAAFT